MRLQLRFSKAFQHMLISFAEIQSTNLCDFLDLELLKSRSHQEFNRLSKISQPAVHMGQHGRASARSHTRRSQQCPGIISRYFAQKSCLSPPALWETWESSPSPSTAKPVCASWKIHSRAGKQHQELWPSSWEQLQLFCLNQECEPANEGLRDGLTTKSTMQHCTKNNNILKSIINKIQSSPSFIMYRAVCPTWAAGESWSFAKIMSSIGFWKLSLQSRTEVWAAEKAFKP